MTHTAYTPELSDDWDLMLDSNGNIRMLRGSEAIAQNVCNEGRLFTEDAYFRAQDGINWPSDQLAKPVQAAVTSEDLRRAAQRVPGVRTVDSVELKEMDRTTRVLRAVVNVTTEGGENGRAEI